MYNWKRSRRIVCTARVPCSGLNDKSQALLLDALRPVLDQRPGHTQLEGRPLPFLPTHLQLERGFQLENRTIPAGFAELALGIQVGVERRPHGAIVGCAPKAPDGRAGVPVGLADRELRHGDLAAVGCKYETGLAQAASVEDALGLSHHKAGAILVEGIAVVEAAMVREKTPRHVGAVKSAVAGGRNLQALAGGHRALVADDPAGAQVCEDRLHGAVANADDHHGGRDRLEIVLAKPQQLAIDGEHRIGRTILPGRFDQ